MWICIIEFTRFLRFIRTNIGTCWKMSETGVFWKCKLTLIRPQRYIVMVCSNVCEIKIDVFFYLFGGYVFKFEYHT